MTTYHRTRNITIILEVMIHSCIMLNKQYNITRSWQNQTFFLVRHLQQPHELQCQYQPASSNTKSKFRTKASKQKPQHNSINLRLTFFHVINYENQHIVAENISIPKQQGTVQHSKLQNENMHYTCLLLRRFYPKKFTHC